MQNAEREDRKEKQRTQRIPRSLTAYLIRAHCTTFLCGPLRFFGISLREPAFTVFLKYENLLLIAASILYPCPYGSNDRF